MAKWKMIYSMDWKRSMTIITITLENIILQEMQLWLLPPVFIYTKEIIKRSLQYSNELLGSNPSQFVRDMTSDVFQAAKSSIQGYPQTYSSPDLPSNILLMRKIFLLYKEQTLLMDLVIQNMRNCLANALFQTALTKEKIRPLSKGKMVCYP